MRMKRVYLLSTFVLDLGHTFIFLPASLLIIKLCKKIPKMLMTTCLAVLLSRYIYVLYAYSSLFSVLRSTLIHVRGKKITCSSQSHDCLETNQFCHEHCVVLPTNHSSRPLQSHQCDHPL